MPVDRLDHRAQPLLAHEVKKCRARKGMIHAVPHACKHLLKVLAVLSKIVPNARKTSCAALSGLFAKDSGQMRDLA